MRLVLALLLLVAPALAGEEVAVTFRELAYGIADPGEAILDQVEAKLAGIDPDWREAWLEPGGLRMALAARLSPAEVRALFARAARDPEQKTERWTNLASSLSSRPDLAGVLVEIDAVSVLWPEERRIVSSIAGAALLQGDPRLAIRLLSDPESANAAAGDLAELSHPDGLRLVADVITGKIEVPPEALAMLEGADLEAWDDHRPVRPLGEERRAALARIAATHPDGAIRELAVEALLSAMEPGTFETILTALEAARTPRIDRDLALQAGKDFNEVPGASLSDRTRISALRGLVRYHVTPFRYSPADAEVFAVWLSRTVAEATGPGFRTALFRKIEEMESALIVEQDGRRLVAPTFRKLLDDLEAGFESDPPAVRAIGRRIAAIERSHLAGGERMRRRKGDGEKVDKVASPVYLEMPYPTGGLKPAEVANRTVEWLAKDRHFLFDPWVGQRLRNWPPRLRRAVLEALPTELIRAFLADPPSRYRTLKQRAARDDLTGDMNRSHLLHVLAHSPAHYDLLLDEGLVRDWPEHSNIALGEALQLVAREKGMDAVLPLLADDEIAFGLLRAALLDPWGDDLRYAARVVTGEIDRPAVLADLAEWARSKMDEQLGPVDNDWPKGRVAQTPAMRVALGNILAEAVDPWVEWLAARILALDESVQAYRLLLAAGDRLLDVTYRSSHPLGDAVPTNATPEHLAATLEFLERADVSPTARASVFEKLLYRTDEEAPAALVAWIEERAPTLDGDLPEFIFRAWLSEIDFLYAEEPAELEAVEQARGAIEKIPAFGPRYRLLRMMDEYE
jgi:hypothetical protein